MKQKLLLMVVFAVCSLGAFAQQITISGKVTDEGNSPLVGATVVVLTDGSGTVTDVDGNYTLKMAPNAEVIFEYMGYESRTMKIAKGGTHNVVLAPSAEALEEVVVVGYGVQRKADLTGSVATVNFDESMSSRPVLNASTALAGLSAGVQVHQSSGQPGTGGTIRIRGNNSLNSNNPLVLVDGIEWDMNNVNTEDIASITILKDAASAAIYGSRAANGVVLVTTKKGAGKAKVTYNFYGTFQQPQNKLKFVSNYAEHMRLHNEGAYNMGRPDVYNESTIAAWEAAALDPNGISEGGLPNYMAYPNTDWFNEIVGTGYSTKHNLSVSGSRGDATYFMSLGYQDVEGIMNQRGMDTGMDQISFRTNLEIKVYDWLKIGTRLNGVKQNKGLSKVSDGFSYLGAAVPGVYPGEDDAWGIPVAVEESTTANNIFKTMVRKGYDKYFRGNFTLYGIINPVKSLTIEASYNYAPDWLDYATWGFPKGTYNHLTNEVVSKTTLDNQTITNKSSKYHRENSEILVRWNPYTGEDHKVSFLGGFTTSLYKQESFSVSKIGMADWTLTQLSTATELSSSASSATDWALMSYFGRANYSFKDKYLLEANVRVDGSSRFAPESRWGVFPSVSAGWRINEEEFMGFAEDWLSNLKLRASWGQMGNCASGNYDWQASYVTNKVVVDGKPSTGLAINKLSNTALEWESTTTTNIGLDWGMFNNRLTGEIDLYEKYTDGILYTPSIPITMGSVTGATQNIAEVRNRGIELTLAWEDRIGDLGYRIEGNFAYNKNRVMKYKGQLEKYWEYDEEGNPTTFHNNYGDVAQSGFGGLILEGHALGEMYMYELYKGNGNYAGGEPGLDQGPVDGMIRTEQDLAWVQAMMASGYKFFGLSKAAQDTLWYGDFIVNDANGDGNYGETNDQNFTGTSRQPLYNFGVNFSMNYKGFDLYMLWAGSAGFELYWEDDVYNTTRTKLGYGLMQSVADDHYFYDPMNPEDPRTNINAKNPRLTNESRLNNGVNTEFYRYKGDYLKLKNLQIGYTLPSKWTRKLKMDKFRVYVSGENLLTLTNYPGLDPEMGTSVTYPLMKQYAIGAQISF